VRSIAPDTWLADVRFRGHPEYIACYVLETGRGLALVDPGPGSTLAALEEQLRIAGHGTEAITDILLTHIHLDHAGATGTLVDRHPNIRVRVHRRGARHMIDPARLLASAERLYGDRMEELWGEFLPVPEGNVHVLEGGEEIRIGRRRLRAEYTPGHAIHHVAYFEKESGLAWVGDTLGIRIDNRPFVLPVTPPPDVDLDGWRESHELIAAWGASTLCPTHFGPARPAHLKEHRERLEGWAGRVREDLASGRSEESCVKEFCEKIRSELLESVDPADVEGYLVGGGVADSWRGLARYWRKRESR